MAHNSDDMSAASAPRVDFSEFPQVSYDQWKQAAVDSLKGGSFDRAMFTKTYEGITLEPLYTADNVHALEGARAYPSQSLMTRGSSASDYVGKLWEIAQPSSDASPADAAAVQRHELERGATSLSYTLDTSAASGCGPSDCGTIAACAADVAELVRGVDLSKHPLHLYAGASSALLLGALASAVTKGGGHASDMRGCVGSDPASYLEERGELPASLDHLFDEMAETIRWAEAHAPHLRTVMARGHALHNAGADAAVETAGAMAAAVSYARAMQERGIGIDVFAKHLRFDLSIGANFFMEIAKFRAARTVWARIAEAFGGGEGARASEIFGRTSFFTKTVYDPFVNMLRTSEEAFAGVIGGADGMTVGCFDEAIRISDEFSRRVARNSQMMLRDEFHLTQPIDPAGGSWYVETLTTQLARKIWEELQRIEGEGGIFKSLEAGSIQGRAEATLKERFKNLASRRDRAVGVNMYANMTERPLEPRPHDRSAEVARAKSATSSADLSAVKYGSTDGSLIDAISGAMASGATFAQVRVALGVDGGMKAAPLAVHRWTEQFEAMRAATEKFQAERGDNVKIFLANMGPIPQHKARADFITGFMEVAGFKVIGNDGHKTTEECAAAAVSSGADVAVICSTDATYPELVPPLAREIKAKAPKMKVLLAGAPAEEHKASYDEAGVDDYVHVRTNCLEFLTGLQREKGMI